MKPVYILKFDVQIRYLQNLKYLRNDALYILMFDVQICYLQNLLSTSFQWFSC